MRFKRIAVRPGRYPNNDSLGWYAVQKAPPLTGKTLVSQQIQSRVYRVHHLRLWVLFFDNLPVVGAASRHRLALGHPRY